MKKIDGKFNFIVIDTKAKELRYTKPSPREIARFKNQDQATEYIENYERPEDLICIIDRHYTINYILRFEEEFKLNKKDFEILKLISVGNSIIGIEKYLKREIQDSITRLRNNKLIQGNYNIKVTEKGEKFL